MSLLMIGVASVAVGLLGHKRRGGFLFFLLLSLLVHPFFGAMVLALSAPVSEKSRLERRGLRVELTPGERRPFFPQRWRRKEKRPEADKAPRVSPWWFGRARRSAAPLPQQNGS